MRYSSYLTVCESLSSSKHSLSLPTVTPRARKNSYSTSVSGQKSTYLLRGFTSAPRSTKNLLTSTSICPSPRVAAQSIACIILQSSATTRRLRISSGSTSANSCDSLRMAVCEKLCAQSRLCSSISCAWMAQRELPTSRAISGVRFAKCAVVLRVLICASLLRRMLRLWEFFLLMRSARQRKRRGLLQSSRRMRAEESFSSRMSLARQLPVAFSFHGEETSITLDRLSSLSPSIILSTYSKMQNNPAVKCKIVMLGDQSVGKTSIINRFIFDNFTGNEQPTVGVDFVSKTINVDNKSLRMQLWDTAGQQRFHSLIPSYIKDSSAAVIVFDITNSSSFGNLNKWIDNVREVRGEEALIMVIGNKCDLDAERGVENALASSKISELGLTYMEVSAKTGHNIKEFFRELAFVIAGGKKSKEETSKPQPASSSNTQPVKAASGTVNLNNAARIGSEKEKKKCEC